VSTEAQKPWIPADFQPRRSSDNDHGDRSWGCFRYSRLCAFAIRARVYNKREIAGGKLTPRRLSHTTRTSNDLRTVPEGLEQRLRKSARFDPSLAVGSNSASSRASARLRATVVFVRRPRASKSERSRLVVDRPASAAATSRSSSASRTESVTSVPSTSSFTKGGAACLSTQRRSADLFKRQILRTRRPTGLDRATLTRRPPARQARTRGAAAGAGSSRSDRRDERRAPPSRAVKPRVRVPSLPLTAESPEGLHGQTGANSSDQPRALTLTESHSLHRIR
jgi:hypothetical protein